VFEGRLVDPHLEFFVVRQAALAGEGGAGRDPWREGYRLEGAKLPPFVNRCLGGGCLSWGCRWGVRCWGVAW